MARKNNGGLDLGGIGKSRLGIGNKASSGLEFSNRAKKSARRGPQGSVGSGQKVPGGHIFSSLSGRSLVLLVLGIIVGIALVVGAGVFAYNQSAQNALKPELNASSLQGTLADEKENSVSWGLMVVTNKGDGAADELTVDQAAMIAMDADNLKISVVWLPSNLRLYVAGHGYQSLSDAYGLLDDKDFIASVANTMGVNFAHYYRASTPGLERYAQEAGFDKGSDKDHYAAALAKKLLGTSSDQISAQTNLFTTYVSMDMDKNQLSTLLQTYKGINVGKAFNTEEVPLEGEQTQEGFAQVKSDDWATMLKRVNSGLDPVAGKAEITSSNAIRSDTTVEIWNGVGVSGIASDCSDYLKSKGWKIGHTGNAASFVYDETLVVYNYDSDQKIAELLVSDLGQGRAVRSAARYSFEGDILVVVGKDYQPY